jgi:hypothetical protein
MKSLELDDVRKCSETDRATYGTKMSSSSLDNRPVRGKIFIFTLRTRETICVGADVATTLKLVLEVNRVPYFDAESRAVDVALEKERPIGRFIGPFVRKIGETSLKVCFAFGGTGRSRCGSRSAGRRRRRSRGYRERWRTKKVEAKMSFCLKIQNLGLNIKAIRSGAGERWDNARRR